MAPSTPKPVNKTPWKKTKEMRQEAKERRRLKRIAKLEKETEAAKVQPNDEKKASETFPVIDRPTLSVAVPGSILENCQSRELKAYVAGQIARAASIYKVDEVIVFDDIGTCGPADVVLQLDPSGSGVPEPMRHSCVQMSRIMQYLETPQQFRRALFPLHKDLEFAGLMNPLDAPHHLRKDEEFPFREGVVTNLPKKTGRGSLVNVGLTRLVQVDKSLPADVRVTVEMLPTKEGSKKLKGRLVSPLTPEAVTGSYWGYTVRTAPSLSAVFTKPPGNYTGGYDLCIGTSDKGQSVDDMIAGGGLPAHKHALLVVGGLAGLEGALEADSKLENVDDPALLFDYYLNTCPGQGTRTIRTEEALLISLSALRPMLRVKKE